MRPRFYRPSGRTTILIVPAFLGALVLAILGAFAYAWVNACAHWSLASITVWMFAGWLAYVARLACRLANVRHPGLMEEIGRTIADMPSGPMLVALADLMTEPGR